METCAVELWTIPLTRECPTHLSEDEVARANRFRFEEDRIRWIRARSSLRLILSRYDGRRSGGACVSATASTANPRWSAATGVEFNLSHAGDWAMVAVARSVPVGVDIERMRANVDMATLLRRLGETDLPQAVAELYQRVGSPRGKNKG